MKPKVCLKESSRMNPHSSASVTPRVFSPGAAMPEAELRVSGSGGKFYRGKFYCGKFYRDKFYRDKRFEYFMLRRNCQPGQKRREGSAHALLGKGTEAMSRALNSDFLELVQASTF